MPSWLAAGSQQRNQGSKKDERAPLLLVEKAPYSDVLF